MDNLHIINEDEEDELEEDDDEDNVRDEEVEEVDENENKDGDDVFNLDNDHTVGTAFNNYAIFVTQMILIILILIISVEAVIYKKVNVIIIYIILLCVIGLLIENKFYGKYRFREEDEAHGQFLIFVTSYMTILNTSLNM